jgi:hypothetical protein
VSKCGYGCARAVSGLGFLTISTRQPNAASPLAELGERLAAATPTDRAEIDLTDYRGLQPPWNDWEHVVERGRRWASVVARIALKEKQ